MLFTLLCNLLSQQCTDIPSDLDQCILLIAAYIIAGYTTITYNPTPINEHTNYL